MECFWWFRFDSTAGTLKPESIADIDGRNRQIQGEQRQSTLKRKVQIHYPSGLTPPLAEFATRNACTEEQLQLRHSKLYRIATTFWFDAQLRKLNISEHIVLAGAMPPTSVLGLYLLFYLWATAALAYLLMLTLGWLMHRYVKTHFMGASLKEKKAVQDQIAKTLAIQAQKGQCNQKLRQFQALLPLTIFIPLQFGIAIMLLGIDTSGWTWMPYYYMFEYIPMFVPPALNPLVAILTIREYRKAFFAPIVQAMRISHASSTTVTPIVHVRAVGVGQGP